MKNTQENPHFGCLQTVNQLHIIYQDIYDILESNKSDRAKLTAIQRKNNQLGKISGKYLPG